MKRCENCNNEFFFKDRFVGLFNGENDRTKITCKKCGAVYELKKNEYEYGFAIMLFIITMAINMFFRKYFSSSMSFLIFLGIEFIIGLIIACSYYLIPHRFLEYKKIK